MKVKGEELVASPVTPQPQQAVGTASATLPQHRIPRMAALPHTVLVSIDDDVRIRRVPARPSGSDVRDLRQGYAGMSRFGAGTVGHADPTYRPTLVSRPLGPQQETLVRGTADASTRVTAGAGGGYRKDKQFPRKSAKRHST